MKKASKPVKASRKLTKRIKQEQAVNHEIVQPPVAQTSDDALAQSVVASLPEQALQEEAVQPAVSAMVDAALDAAAQSVASAPLDLSLSLWAQAGAAAVAVDAGAGAGAAAGAGASTATTAAAATGAALSTGAIVAGVAAVGVAAAAAGGGGSSTPPPVVSTDTTAPVITFTAATDDVGSVTGALTSGATTDDTALVLSGTAEAGATVKVYNGTTFLGNATLTGTNWTYTATVANGTAYLFNATATDAAGNVSAATSNFTVIGDTTAPAIASLAARSATRTIELTYGEALDATNVPLPAGFTVTTGGVANTVTGVSVAGTVMTLTLQDAFAPGAVTLNYTDPTAGNDVNAIQDAAGNDAASFTSAVIADGYLRGATVYIDTNSNGVADPATDYLVGTTDESGNFFIQAGAPTGTIIAIGGVNIDTGVANTTALKAPAGSTTINPLTTLVQAVVDASGGTTTAAAAATAVATSLGLTGLGGQSLLNYDPISAGNVGAQKAAAQVATIVALAESSSAGAGSQVIANLATVVNNAGAATVVLADASTISAILPAAVQSNASATSAISDASTSIGNAVSISAISTAQSQALDTIAPTAPTSLSVAATTNDTTPSVRVNFNTTATNGTAAVAGDTITLRENGAQAGTPVTLTAADIAAGFKLVDASTLSEGSHTLSAVLTDQAGNVSAVATGVVANIDTQAPAAPVINAVATDDVINSSEQSAVVSGLAEANATVSLSIGGNSRAATANGSGSWSYTLQAADITAMGQDAETLSATATDAAGNTSAAGTRSITVDTVAPTATAAVTSGAAIISDNTPALAGTITGTLGAGEVVAVYDGATRLGLATVSGSAWTFNTPSRSNALHTFTAKVEDAAGNSGSAGTAYAVTVNATVPTATATITSATDDVAANTGDIAAGGISNDSIPVLGGAVVGTLGADSVAIYDGATRLGTATVTGTSWSYTPSALSAGAHSFTAVVETSAGNQGVMSTAYGLTLDFTEPNAAVINPVAIDGKVNATEKAAGIVVTGTAEAGSTVAVTWGTAAKSVTATGGVWSVTFASSEVPADNVSSTISATVTDTAGNAGVAATRTVLIDSTGPVATISSVSGDNAINAAEATTGVTVSGTTEANAKVALSVGTGNIRSLAADGSGNWTYQLSATDIKAMGQGSETLSVTATDAAGNSGSAATQAITIDTTAPVLTAFSLTDASDSGIKGDGRSNVGAPTLSFTAELGATLAIDSGSGSYVAAGITGTGSVQTLTKPSPFATDGTYVINLKATDAAGNITVRTASYLYDSSAPSAPAISAIADNVGTITGNLANNARSDDTQLVITGTAEAYSTVTVYNGSTTLGTAAANASGNWSYTTATLTNATAYVFSAKATDVAGNQGAASTTTTVTIDTSPPVAPAVALATDGGSSASDGITNVGTVNVTGLEADATWQYSTNGGTSFSTGTGTSFTLAAGTYAANAVQVKQTDVAGNAGVVGGNAAPITVDATAPAAPAFALATDSGTSASDGITNVGTLNVTGLESGASWQYSTDGGTNFSNGTGTSFTLTAATYATGAIKVRQIDVAGNTGAVISNTAALVVDQTAPTATAAVTEVDDNVEPTTGNLNSGDTTNDTTLGLFGLITGTLATGDVVSVYDGATRLGLASVAVNGSAWTFTTATLGNAVHNFTARVEDVAGNQGSAGTPYVVTVNASVPTATATIAGAADDVAANTGNVATGGTSNDSTPTLSGAVVGTLASGEVVAIYDGATKLGNATVNAATWSYTPSALSGGAHSFTAAVESAVGNQGAVSSAYAVTLDLTAPAAPVISAVATDDIVSGSEQTAAISGTAEANATVNLSLGGNTRTATASALGAWSYTLTGADVTAMGQGAETLSATATDVAGTTGSAVTRSISVDTVEPNSTSLVVNGSTLTVTFNEALDSVHTPSVSTLSVLVNGVARSITNAAFSGTTATITLASAVSVGETVTISYTDPTAGDDVNALQDLAGNDISSASNVAVTNNSSGDVTAPTIVSAVAQDRTLTLTYSEALDATHQPSTSYFQVAASTGAARSIEAMQISGSTVVLTLSKPLLPSGSGTTYTLLYNDPSAGNDVYAVQDAAGNDAASYAAQAITVNAVSGTDITAPSIVGATVTPGTLNASVTLQFSEAVTFTNATGLTLSSSTGSSILFTLGAGATSDTLVLTTTTALAATDTVIVAYNSGTGSIKDTAATPNSLVTTTIVVGGDGANTITASSAVVIRANSGGDTITGSSSSDSIAAGGGVDTVDGGNGADTISLNEGTRAVDTVKLLANNTSWIPGYDTVYAFDVSNAGGTNNDVLNLPSGTIAADAGVTAGTAVNTIAKHSIASGIVSFYDASSVAVAINTSLLKADALNYLSANLTQAGRTVGFALDSDGNGQSDSLMVFQDGVAVNGFGNSDIVAQLAGVNGVTLSNTAGQNVVQIEDKTAPTAVVRTFTSGANGVLSVLQSEDVNPFASGTTVATILVNGSGSDVVTARTATGNTVTFTTSATLAQTDWLLFTSGNNTADAALNQVSFGLLSVTGGSGANVIDAGGVVVSGVTGTATVNINSYAGNDQITGTAAADVIWGGAGADTVSGGLGADQFRFIQGDSTAVTVAVGGDSTLNTGDVFTFAGGAADVVHGRFDVAGTSAGSGDRIQLFSLANQSNPTSMTMPANGLVTDQKFYVVQGNYDAEAGSFFVSTTLGLDTLVVYDGDASAAVSQTAVVVQGHTPTTLTISGNTLYANVADTDATAPTLTTATVNGVELTLTFSESIDPVHTPVTFPVVLVGGVSRTLVDGAVNGNVVTLVLQTAVISSDVVTFSYTDPTSGNDANALQDLAGNDVASGAAIPVTNQTVAGTPPTLSASLLDNVTNLEVSSNIVLNFSANVSAAAGKSIHIINDGGAGFHGESTVNTLDIRVTDTSQVTIVNGKVTINPTADLDLANNYHITIDAGAFTATATGAAMAAYDGTTTLNFSTVTPGATALANAVASQVMNTDGTLGAGHLWLDIEGIGSPSASAGTEPMLDLSSGNYALAAKDYDAAGPIDATGYDGVKTGDFYVGLNNFGAGDLLYIDNQSSVANNLIFANIIDDGTPPTTLRFAGTSLGSLVDISLSGTTTTFSTIDEMKLLLGTATSPVISA